jgi:predicted dinucleotide-binding enzyme
MNIAVIGRGNVGGGLADTWGPGGAFRHEDREPPDRF